MGNQIKNNTWYNKEKYIKLILNCVHMRSSKDDIVKISSND